MKGMVTKEGSGEGELSFNLLPEGCVANVLSFTDPRGACKLSTVSTLFKSAAESDAVWEKLLPHDYRSIISNSDSSSLLTSVSSKKDLYLRLCDNPIIIDHGKKSFSLEKTSGKKCYMLSARDLVIIWGDTPTYWRWNADHGSRFGKVAELIGVCWLEIRGKINIGILSPATMYTAYLVFKTTTGAYGLEYLPAEVTVGLVGGECDTRTVYLDADRGRGQPLRFVRRRGIGFYNRGPMLRMVASVPPSRENNDVQYPKERKDGWLEVELGYFFCQGGEDGELEMSVQEVKGGDWKGGLIIEGIEIRPKD